jgi:hypothetical protein
MYFSRRFRKHARGLTRVVLAAIAFAAPLNAASTVTLGWNPNPEPDIAGYKVYLGISSRTYTSVVDAGNQTSQALSNLVPGATYYFAATAYNTSGLESAFSSEVSYGVTNANTAPVISDIANAEMPANTSLTISFTVQDAETSAGSLSMNATSSNSDLMPESNILLGGSGETRTVTLTPDVDQSGTTTITILVSDGSLSASKSFALNVSVPPAALVAAYSFDALGGRILHDAAGNANNGVIDGALWSATGRFGGALAFDGADDVVTVADANTLDLSSGMTIEAWVYPTAQAGVWRSILAKESVEVGGGVYNLYADTDTGVPAVTTVRRSGTFDEVRGTNPVPANTWTHLAATYDAKMLRLFVNGIELSRDAVRGRLLTSTGPLRIGGNSLRGEYFKGMIDELRIYNRALSPSEIEADMGTPLGSDALTTLLQTADTEASISGVSAPAGTDIPFVIDVVPVADSVLIQLTWESIPGAIYRVLGKTDPLELDWLDLSADILAQGSVTSWVDPYPASLVQLYRVIVVE